MLQYQTQQFLSSINNDSSSEENVSKAMQDFLNSFRESNESDQAIALQQLTASLISNNGKHINVLASFIGFLFESGFHSDLIISQLVEYFEKLLFSASKISQSLAEKIEVLSISENEDDEDEPETHELFEQYYPEISQKFPEASADWEKFEKIWCCGIALFSVSNEARKKARYLRPSAHQNSEFNEGAYWFDIMLSVFDDEPFIAIERDKMLGIKGKMSGVVENFQLQILLMDIFPIGWFPSGNLAPEIIQNAKGFGQQCLDIGVKGRWNMYQWTAVQADSSLPDHTNTKASNHWIWGEGKPEDIPLFEGYRVILLGKPSYERGWGAKRMFSHLKAELKVEQKLSRNEVFELLKRMAQTPKIPATEI